jgi:hypothetical protein
VVLFTPEKTMELNVDEILVLQIFFDNIPKELTPINITEHGKTTFSCETAHQCLDNLEHGSYITSRLGQINILGEVKPIRYYVLTDKGLGRITSSPLAAPTSKPVLSATS